MKKGIIIRNILVTLISLGAAIITIAGLNMVSTDDIFVKCILILTSIIYGLILPYYIWKQN